MAGVNVKIFLKDIKDPKSVRRTQFAPTEQAGDFARALAELTNKHIEATFAAEGAIGDNPKWARLTPYSAKLKADAGYGDKPILQETGLLKTAATSFKPLTITQDKVVLRAVLPNARAQAVARGEASVSRRGTRHFSLSSYRNIYGKVHQYSVGSVAEGQIQVGRLRRWLVFTEEFRLQAKILAAEYVINLIKAKYGIR